MSFDNSVEVSREDTESKLWQLAGKRNFEVLEHIDCFLHVFDRMPKRMKLVVDMKVQGMTEEEISKLLKIKKHSVDVQLDRALKMFMRHMA